MTTFGIAQATWDAAKLEVRILVGARAQAQGWITYSDLASTLTQVRFEAHDPRLFALIGDVSKEEDRAGRGMLSAIIIHKTGDMKPGPGFFDLARDLGRDVRDEDAFWIAEVRLVHAIWRTYPG